VRANILVLVVIVIIILLGVKRGSADNYEFIVYPLFQEASIASLGIDFGEPRLNSDSAMCLTNKNSNLPLTPNELERVKRLLDVEIVGSDSIAVYLEENGWNEGGGE
jgi:hypothetical protein